MNVLSIIICKETTLKACGSFKSGKAPIPINSRMSNVANQQLIFKISCLQKFSILVLNFKDFLKNTFKWGFARMGPYSYKQNLRPYSYKTAFTNINKVSSFSILISFYEMICF